MEDDLQEEVQKLIDYVKPKIGTPCTLNRTLNISIVNALWFILAGEKLELNDPKLNELTEAIDDVLRYYFSISFTYLLCDLSYIID